MFLGLSRPLKKVPRNRLDMDGVPFGGMKESGLGREGGHEGIAEFLETKLGGFSIQ